MEQKNFIENLDKIKEISKKLEDPSTSMEEALELYKIGTEKIKKAKEQLETIEGEVKKVLDDNSLEEFK
ncbi:exodeoxyribonuclease VII small subunit [Spiroplasma tabanidicola]|uniref:Exodeoxyribonuclease VII small subunit n=1 Tax=Spiroplasma tabanidicola TaxID=324079 RepID=A0A6I6C877_9MOLU|nr:exodeoxyribonuclease VII small subunit [Spiroplasma tabanidicola]QGS51946.1 exodeoxyribonuclease VII small subunit [Spiroplasma tabanidicola]